MYQLTCPSCKTPYKTPFIRMGAVAICANCSHKYPVKTEYFVKLPPENPVPPELVDRLLGIVPMAPGSTGMAMANSAINQATASGVFMPNAPTFPISQSPTGPRPPAQANKTTPPQTAGTQAGAAPGNKTVPPQTAAPARPATQVPAAAANKTTPPATQAPAPAPAPQAPEPKQEEQSSGFFGKLFKRFK
jgi:hypothetical protein